jgi:ElaB/YqjD/DUF883 family membrane-anchored ribosome-binding protein
MSQFNQGTKTYNPVESKKDVMDTVKDKISDVATGAADMARTAKDKAGEFAHNAKDKVSEWAGDASDKAGDLAQEATQLIRRYPMQSIAAGMALGFLIAFAMTRD